MFHGRPIYRWKLPKRGGGGWTVYKFKGEGMTKESGVVFFEVGGVDTPVYTIDQLKIGVSSKANQFLPALNPL